MSLNPSPSELHARLELLQKDFETVNQLGAQLRRSCVTQVTHQRHLELLASIAREMELIKGQFEDKS